MAARKTTVKKDTEKVFNQASAENTENTPWRTMAQKPAKREVCIIAIPPDVVRMAAWDGRQFVNAMGIPTAKPEDVAYWMPIPKVPWSK